MPFVTPNLRQVRARVRDDVTARIPGSDANVPNSNLRVMSEANAGLAHTEHTYFQWLSKQFLADTAEDVWLLRLANMWLRRGIRAATFASATVAVTGTTSVVIPAGTLLLFGSLEYTTVDEITIGPMDNAAEIVATLAGAASTLEIGSALRWSEAIAGLDATVTVTATTPGIDEESIELLRSRVLDRMRQPPMGGDANDYVAWTMEVPGVTRAWCAPLEMGIGTVTVRFMMDELRSGTAGFPLSGDLVTVADYLDTVRPVSVKDLFVVAPVAEPIDFTITNLDRDTASVRAAITASVTDMLSRRAVPGQTIWHSWVSEAVSSATGEDHHDPTFADHTMPTLGHLAVLGTITYA